MTKERLFFKGVSEIVGTEDLGLLILTNESCERQITIVCDKAMAVQLELRIKNIPVTKIMFPEVLCKLLKANTAFNYELVMDDIIDGQYRTILYDKKTGQYQVGETFSNDMDERTQIFFLSASTDNTFTNYVKAENPEDNPVIQILHLRN